MKYKTPSFLQSITPIIFLVVMLSINVFIFGDLSLDGSNQIVLILSGALAAIIAYFNGVKWKILQEGMVSNINSAIPSLIILLLVGALAGSWMISGIVPSMIYYGIQILSPDIFLLASCIICIIVSLATGSSWTTSATIGIALMGVGKSLGVDDGFIAGAVLSGAYFGDKMSPLSDTTNLAPAVAGTDLFTHIGHMMWTTIPSIVIALVLFGVIGFNIDTSSSSSDLEITMGLLKENFTINFIMLLPVVVLLVMANKKLPPIPTILAGILLGIVIALIFQKPAIINLAGETPNVFLGLFKGVWYTLFDGFAISSGNETLDDLMTRGGMSSMLWVIWLVLCAMVFGAVMDHTGLLRRLVEYTLSFVHSTGSLIATTIATCFGSNIITSDQYISVVLPGRMYKHEYKNRNLDMKNLSRTLEDSGTITSPLIPWNTCGAFMAGTLGVATFAYVPYCFFNLINPVVAIIYGFLNFKITPTIENQPEQ